MVTWYPAARTRRKMGVIRSRDSSCSPTGTPWPGLPTPRPAFARGNFSKLAPYVTAQMLGGFAGAVLVWLHFLPHWAGTGDPIRKLSCFCSHAAIPNRAANLIGEIIPTSLLVFVAGCILSRRICPPVWVHSSLARWCGASYSRWRGPPARAGILLAILAPGSPMRFFRFRGKASPIGGTLRFQCSAHFGADCSADWRSGYYTCRRSTEG